MTRQPNTLHFGGARELLVQSLLARTLEFESNHGLRTCSPMIIESDRSLFRKLVVCAAVEELPDESVPMFGTATDGVITTRYGPGTDEAV